MPALKTAIPQAEEKYGQLIETPGPVVKTPDLAPMSAVVGALALAAADRNLARAQLRGTSDVLDTIDNAYKAVERTQAKEYESAIRVAEKTTRREILDEEQEFLKTSKRLFTPQETQKRYEVKMGNVGRKLQSEYKFSYLREEVATFHKTFTKEKYEDYQSTVLHAKNLDAAGLALVNTKNNYMETAKEAHASGDALATFEALASVEQTLKDPTHVLLKGGETNHAVWLNKELIQLRKDALDFMTPQERMKLFSDFKTDPKGTLNTAQGTFFKHFLASADFEKMVQHDINTDKHQKDIARTERDRVYEANQAKHEMVISEAFREAANGNKAWDYNKQRTALDNVRQQLGEKNYAQSLIALNNKDVTLNRALKLEGTNGEPWIYGPSDGKDRKKMDRDVKTAFESGISVDKIDVTVIQHLKSPSVASPYIPPVWKANVIKRLGSEDESVARNGWSVMATIVATPAGAKNLKATDPALYAAAVMYAQSGNLKTAQETMARMKSGEGKKENIQARESIFNSTYSLSKNKGTYDKAIEHSKYFGDSSAKRSSQFDAEFQEAVKNNIVYAGLDPEAAFTQGLIEVAGQGWRAVMRPNGEGKLTLMMKKHPIESYIAFHDPLEQVLLGDSMRAELGVDKGTRINLRYRLNQAGEVEFEADVYDRTRNRFAPTGKKWSIKQLQDEVNEIRQVRGTTPGDKREADLKGQWTDYEGIKQTREADKLIDQMGPGVSP